MQYVTRRYGGIWMTVAAVTVVSAVAGAWTSAVAKTVTLKMMIMGSGKRLAEEKAVLAEFEAQHPGIKVKATVVRGGYVYYDKYIAMTAAGEVPDVMMVGSDIFGRIAKTLRPLDTLLSPGKTELAGIRQDFLDAFSRNGRLYSLPMAIDLVAMAYNDTMFRASGLPSPTKSWEDPKWSWDQFAAVARKMTVDKNGDGKPDQFGFGDLSSGWWQMEIPYIWGADWISDRKVTADVAKAAKGFEFWLGMKSKLGAVGGGMAKSAMWTQAGWGSVDALQSSKGKFIWDFCAVPAGENRATLGYINSIAVPMGVKNPKESWLLAKYLAVSQANPRWVMSWGSGSASSEHSSWYIEQGKLIGLDHRVLVEANKYVHTPGYFGLQEFTRLDDAIAVGLAPFWSGRISAEQALKSVIPQLTKILGAK